MDNFRNFDAAIILSRQVQALVKWRLIAEALNLHSVEIYELGKSYKNKSISAFELFSEILQDWKEKNPKVATINPLVTVLESLELHSVAALLSTIKTREVANKELETRRRLYKCGSDYIDLKSILTWHDSPRNQEIVSSVVDRRYSVDSPLNSKISIFKGDINALEVDAIVTETNAENTGFYKFREDLGECEAKITRTIAAKHLIQMSKPSELKEELIQKCFRNMLTLMVVNDFSSIAFPTFSIGAEEGKKETAIDLALSATRQFLEENGNKVQRIVFCTNDDAEFKLYEKFSQKHFPLD